VYWGQKATAIMAGVDLNSVFPARHIVEKNLNLLFVERTLGWQDTTVKSVNTDSD